MITPSFSPTATERVLPKLALDLTTASLDSRVTFTRTTDATHPATYVNSSGYVTASTNNAPRFDYSTTSVGTCKGLLIEESRANLTLQSQDFSTSWTPTSVAVGTDVAVSPDGTQNADKLTWNNGIAAGSASVKQQIAASAGTAYTLSLFVKAAGQDTVNIVVNAWNSVPVGITFMYITANLTSASITGSAFNAFTSGSYSITAYPNSWYRITITATTPATTAYLVYNITSGAVGDGANGVYVWGAQTEAGAFATSYIPTTTTSLTRNADVAIMTGTNFSSWWTATTGAANSVVIPKSITGTKPVFQMDDNTADNIISLRGNVENPELYVKATTDQVQIDAGTIAVNTAYNLCGTWNTNNCAAAQNGAAVVVDTSATIPTVTQARIGSDGTNYANAWIQKINYWPQKITNNETQAFSK